MGPENEWKAILKERMWRIHVFSRHNSKFSHPPEFSWLPWRYIVCSHLESACNFCELLLPLAIEKFAVSHHHRSTSSRSYPLPSQPRTKGTGAPRWGRWLALVHQEFLLYIRRGQNGSQPHLDISSSVTPVGSAPSKGPNAGSGPRMRQHIMALKSNEHVIIIFIIFAKFQLAR